MYFNRQPVRRDRKQALRQIVRRALRLETLDPRQLLAANVMDDTFTIGQGSVLHVLANDTNGSEVQAVSAANIDFVIPTGLQTDWFIPDRPGVDPAMPQRSLIPGAIVDEPGQNNFGDVDFWLDMGGTIDTSDDVPMTRLDGMVIGTVRENIIPASGASSTNLAVLGFNNTGGDTTNVWLSTQAAPQNAGELPGAQLAVTRFPFTAGWRASGFAGAYTPPGMNITSTTVGTGRYEIAVDGVNDSNLDGYLFTIASGNSDNYTQSMPLGGNRWLVARRDNSHNFDAGENGSFNVLYVPANSTGLIGGHVNADGLGVNPLYRAAGDFAIQRTGDGLWRMSIPGQSPTTGILMLESNDVGRGAPSNAYLSYEADGDDFIIRQLEGHTMNPLNDDFNVVFVPFENVLQPTAPLTVNSLGTTAEPTGAVSELGVGLVLNADGTVTYQPADGAIRALAAGETRVDAFIYEATDGNETAIGTVTVTWAGANDAPTVEGTIPAQTFNEDEAPRTFDLAPLFNDVDNGDVLTYSIDPGIGGILQGSISGSILTLGPAANRFGFTFFTVIATDSQGATASFRVATTVFSQVDGPQAVDDAAVTNNTTPIDIDVKSNDFHPDTTEFSVAAARIDADPAATTNETSIFTIAGTSSSPNELTVQSSPNLGDVAIGRNGQNLSFSDGVLIGTAADNTSPYQTVTTYDAFGSYGFATNLGIGDGERNSPINAGFFPFAEGWVSGHVSPDGELLGGVGVAQSNITKIETGLFEVTIPGMNSMGAFFDSGMLLATANANADKIISVNPRVSGGWQVRIVDSDSDGSDFFTVGEDHGWSFVYIPANAPSLIGGHVVNDGSFLLGRQYGGVTAVSQGGGLEITVPGYTPADGTIVAIYAGDATLTSTSGQFKIVPASRQVMVTTSTNDNTKFRLEAFNSGSYGGTTDQAYFVFLPYAQPQELIPGLDLSITAVAGTSALGATVTLNADGTVNYNPTTGNASLTGLEAGQSIQDTFTYTLSDARSPARTSTGTVTVTVTGQNQPPTANDDVINANEVNVNGARLTVLRNDVDPDLATIFGTPVGIPAANLAVDGSGTWSVAQTAAAANEITLGTTGTGSVELLNAGAPIARADGVVLATIRENGESPNTNFRFVQAFENGSGGTSLAIGQFGADAAADAQVSVSLFRFDDNWIGGHVDALGGLLAGNGVAAGNVVRTAVGSYVVSIPGVTDASLDGFLYVIGNENADNVVSAQAVAGTNRFVIAVRDNQQDAADREDGGFSFVFVPRTAQNLVAGTIDPNSTNLQPVTLGVGEFSIVREPVATGGNQWKLTIPGQSPDSGMLILTNQNPNFPEDNYLTYESDGADSFLIRSHDLPNLGRQNMPFTFTFVPFDAAMQPVFRPVPDVLSIASVDATSALGATLSINPDGTINYLPGTVLDALYDGDSAVDTFSYTMSDGFGGSSSATVTLNIAGVGQPVAIGISGGETYYAVGDAPIGVEPAATLSDFPTPFLDGATLSATISAGAASGDVLSIRNEGTGANQVGVSGSDVTFGGTVIGTFVGDGSASTPLVITFGADVTLASAQAVLRAVSFGNPSMSTSLSMRTVEFELVDGNARTAGSISKDIELGLLRRRALRQNTDQGFGLYTGAADIELSEITPDTPQPTGRVASDGLLVDRRDNATSATPGTNETHVLLKFADIFGMAPGQIPADAIITSAKLTLDTNNSGHGASMHRLLQAFDFDAATWNSTGAGIQADGVEAATTWESQFGVVNNAGTTGTGLTSVSVLPDIVAWQAGETNHGWAMLPWNGGTDGWGFTASEGANQADRPLLEIEWLPAGTEVASFRQGVDGYDGAQDTVIRENAADTPADADTTLFVDFTNPGSANTNQVLLRFDEIIGETLGQIPAGATVISAQLRLASLASNAPGDGGQFHAMLADWSDSDTWNTLVDGISADDSEAVATASAAAGNATRNPNAQGGFNAFDVTSDVQAWVDGTLENRGWAILPWNLGTDGWAVQSSESTLESDRPILSVYYLPPALAPEFSITPLVSLNEGDSGTTTFSFTVTRGGLTNGAATVDYTFAAGDTSADDFVGGTFPANGQVSFADGETTAVIKIEVNGDTEFEADESFTITLTNPSVGSILTGQDVGTGTIINDDAEDAVPPTIGSVMAASAQWSAAFIDAVDGAGNGLGYQLTSSAPIPWNNVNQLYVQFSEDVIGISASTVELRDSTGPLAIAVSYDAATFIATITPAAPLGFSKLRLAVAETVTDGAGNALDGDADGTAGGMFNFRFDVLPGDSNSDGRVNGSDLGLFSNSFNAQAGQANFQPFADWNADSRVNGADLAVFSANFNRNIATLPEPGAPFGGSGAGGTGSRLFGAPFDDFFGSFGQEDEEDSDKPFGFGL